MEKSMNVPQTNTGNSKTKGETFREYYWDLLAEWQALNQFLWVI